MSFEVTADAYLRFMGRFSEPLAAHFADFARLDEIPARVLDVGCGPGVLTRVLVARRGTDQVSAVDPSESFVAATAERIPGVDVRRAAAESLPYDDHSFGAALAQLVVHFMADPVAGLREMGRVTQPGGVVAACVWDHAPDGGGPVTLFWRAARDVDPAAPGEAALPGSREGDLARLAIAAGLTAVESSALTVRVRFASADEWWAPYLLGVGPAGAYLAGLDDERRDRIRRRCAELLPAAPFEQPATAWCVRAWST